MSIISATHWAKDPYEPGFFARETRTFGTLRAATMWAESVVPPIVTTNGTYWRDTARGEHVDFTRIERAKNRSNGRWWRARMSPAGSYDAPVRLVPSVGELGWTP
jgi:hypothetical protein